jgi:hypothetical protein
VILQQLYFGNQSGTVGCIIPGFTSSNAIGIETAFEFYPDFSSFSVQTGSY